MTNNRIEFFFCFVIIWFWFFLFRPFRLVDRSDKKKWFWCFIYNGKKKFFVSFFLSPFLSRSIMHQFFINHFFTIKILAYDIYCGTFFSSSLHCLFLFSVLDKEKWANFVAVIVVVWIKIKRWTMMTMIIYDCFVLFIWFFDISINRLMNNHL